MANQKFVDGLRQLGYNIGDVPDNKVTFDYEIKEGRHKSKKIKLGFEVPPDFEMTPPSGPHLYPRFLPMNPQAPNHPDRVADSGPFGKDWQYLSRPFPNWPGTTRTVGVYMHYVDHLLNTL